MEYLQEQGESPVCTVSIMFESVKEGNESPIEEDVMKNVTAAAYLGTICSHSLISLFLIIRVLGGFDSVK